jgi:FkbM family methyltransferase
VNLEEYEKLDPRCVVREGELEVVYATPTKATKWRVDTLFQKEPVTIEWIAGFQAGEVLVDVGANVGMYTLWAAKTRGVRVFAFEPEALNYALLNRNIFHNKVSQQVRAFCVALSDRAGLGELHLSRFMAGGSSHSLDEQVDPYHRPAQPAFTQGCVSATLDDLVRDGAVASPDHIKIDVDGFEPKVIRGAAQTLRAGRIRSLLIEVNQSLADHMAMVAELGALGFRHDPEQVRRAERRSGYFKGCAEYVFTR